MYVFENIRATAYNLGLAGIFSGSYGELPEQQ